MRMGTEAKMLYYVPRYLLRRFGGGKKDRVHVFDRHTGALYASRSAQSRSRERLFDFRWGCTWEPAISL